MAITNDSTTSTFSTLKKATERIRQQNNARKIFDTDTYVE